MKRYIGMESIEATPMHRGEYNIKRGWVIPPDENPSDEGYLVKYPDGHISWSPKAVFEEAYSPSVSIVQLQHDLLSNKYTTVLHETEIEYDTPHHFEVYADRGQQVPKLLASVNFQKGPIKENGVNGVCNEDLIAMVICRLEHFQRSKYSSRDNAMAITKMEEALLWLRKRTISRENRGVEGTSVV